MKSINTSSQTRESGALELAYQSTLSPASKASFPNILSADVEIKGLVKFANDLVLDGKIEGEILSDGNLTVGENGWINAEVKISTIVVHGTIYGSITASDRVTLKASAKVFGDIRCNTISIEAGASFIGKGTVGLPSQRYVQRKSGAQISDLQKLSIYLPEGTDYSDAEAILIAAGNLMDLMGYEYDTEDQGALQAAGR